MQAKKFIVCVWFVIIALAFAPAACDVVEMSSDEAFTGGITLGPNEPTSSFTWSFAGCPTCNVFIDFRDLSLASSTTMQVKNDQGGVVATLSGDTLSLPPPIFTNSSSSTIDFSSNLLTALSNSFTLQYAIVETVGVRKVVQGELQERYTGRYEGGLEGNYGLFDVYQFQVQSNTDSVGFSLIINDDEDNVLTSNGLVALYVRPCGESVCNAHDDYPYSGRYLNFTRSFPYSVIIPTQELTLGTWYASVQTLSFAPLNYTLSAIQYKLEYVGDIQFGEITSKTINGYNHYDTFIFSTPTFTDEYLLLDVLSPQPNFQLYVFHCIFEESACDPINNAALSSQFDFVTNKTLKIASADVQRGKYFLGMRSLTTLPFSYKLMVAPTSYCYYDGPHMFSAKAGDKGSIVFKPYNNLTNCIYAFDATACPNCKFLFSFSYFDIEYSFDFVYIFDGGSTADLSIAQNLTGHSLPPSFLSSSNQAMVQILADDSISFSGFVLNYTCLSLSSSDLVTFYKDADIEAPTSNQFTSRSIGRYQEWKFDVPSNSVDLVVQVNSTLNSRNATYCIYAKKCTQPDCLTAEAFSHFYDYFTCEVPYTILIPKSDNLNGTWFVGIESLVNASFTYSVGFFQYDLSGCSGNGTLDITTMKCVCKSGYEGRDCRSPVCTTCNLIKSEVSREAFYSITALSGVCFIGTVVILILVLCKITHHEFVKSAPIFSCITLAGAMCAFVSVPLFGIDSWLTTLTTYTCMAPAWVLGIGFALGFAGPVAKLYHINKAHPQSQTEDKDDKQDTDMASSSNSIGHSDNNNCQTETVTVTHEAQAELSITDLRVLPIASVLIGIEIALLTIWTITDRLQPAIGTTATHIYAKCAANLTSSWVIFFVVYNIVMLLLGVFYAFKTRNITWHNSESKYIGFCVYTVLFCGIVCYPIAATFDSAQLNTTFIVISIAVLGGTSSTVGALFIPPLHHAFSKQ